MATKQIVMLKGEKDGISISLDNNAGFDAIKESLRNKVSQGKRFFDGANSKISFRGRELDDNEEKILLDIVTEETELDITIVYKEGSETLPRANTKTVFDEKTNTAPPVEVAVSAKQNLRESKTAYYHGGLRSGQSIRYAGSVVVMGDVNPGSEIVADGNVVVLGALKGMAHAGASGDESCFVSALILQPTQLRIAGTISFVPDTARSARSSAAYAYIKDGQVFIGPL
ncbi:MAG: septum site-determining protein MinC [Defluviitaleaceae bacterium]|nr:septum site-determining protein MinC [Defluviitaleaceae bacterium]